MLTEKKLAELAEQTAEELMDRANRMLALGRELMGMAGQLAATASDIPLTGAEVRELLPQDRSVGRFGAVTEGIALARAREVGTFTTGEFAEALGLDAPGAMKWIARLIATHTVVREPGAKFRCLLKPPLKIWVVRQAGSAFTYDEASEATGLSDEELSVELQKLLGEGVVREDEGLWEYVPPSEANPREHLTLTPPERYPPSYADAPPRGEPVRTKRASRRGASTPGQAQKIKNSQREFERQLAAKEARAEEQRLKTAATNGGGGKRNPRYRKQK